MASPGIDERSYILSVTLQEGKGFGPDVQAIVCAATFAGETKLTPYSVGRDAHVWNTTLQWRLTLDHFRRLSAQGQKDCKVVLTTKDGTKLGWFLVDVRAAKLQAQYKKDEGSWTAVNGAKKGDSPQVCVLSLFYEDGPGAPSPPQPRRSPQRPRGARRQPPTTTSGVPEPDATHDSNPYPEPAAGSGPDGSGTGAAGLEATAAGWVEAGAGAGHVHPGPHPTTGLPKFGSPGRSPAEDGPFRNFSLSVDVRTFQSSKRLPLSSASVYVQAVLPPEIIELVVASGHRLPSRLAPLRSHPPVDMPRGTECALPNGYGTVEFSAGVVQLARVLAQEPRISVEAWHKERFRTDMLLGSGTVPLSPLLQGAWVDGYAPLYAVVASSVGGELREERVQMGMLRVVLSLEDKGPALPPGAGAASNATAGLGAAAASGSGGGTVPGTMPLLNPRPSPYDEEAAVAAAEAAAEVAAAGGEAAEAQEAAEGALAIREIHPALPMPPSTSAAAVAAGLPVHSAAAPPDLRLPPPAEIAGVGAMGRGPGGVGALATAPEFEAAWELEVWKKAEEARWRSELREREAQRMAVLEAEWRRRERAREAEIAALKAEYLVLEERAQQVLSAAEARERRIVAAEEALLRRRKELEREHAGRMAEAEAAVRRLQVECEHQLDIERDRNAELVRRVAVLEERLAASEARGLAVENEFADFRAAVRATPEAELSRQLAEAREAAKAAEARAAKAAKAKQGYKEQVRKLAEQLASLQRRRHREDDAAQGAAAGTGAGPGRPPLLAAAGLGGGGGGGGSDALRTQPQPSIRAAAEDQARYAASQQRELAAMRAQLQAIKAAALAQLSPSNSPPRPGRSHPVAGGGGGGADGAAAVVASASGSVAATPAAGQGGSSDSSAGSAVIRTSGSNAAGGGSAWRRDGEDEAGGPAGGADVRRSSDQERPGHRVAATSPWRPSTVPLAPTASAPVAPLAAAPSLVPQDGLPRASSHSWAAFAPYPGHQRPSAPGDSLPHTASQQQRQGGTAGGPTGSSGSHGVASKAAAAPAVPADSGSSGGSGSSGSAARRLAWSQEAGGDPQADISIGRASGSQPAASAAAPGGTPPEDSAGQQGWGPGRRARWAEPRPGGGTEQQQQVVEGSPLDGRGAGNPAGSGASGGGSGGDGAAAGGRARWRLQQQQEGDLQASGGAGHSPGEGGSSGSVAGAGGVAGRQGQPRRSWGAPAGVAAGPAAAAVGGYGDGEEEDEASSLAAVFSAGAVGAGRDDSTWGRSTGQSLPHQGSPSQPAAQSAGTQTTQRLTSMQQQQQQQHRPVAGPGAAWHPSPAAAPHAAPHAGSAGSRPHDQPSPHSYPQAHAHARPHVPSLSDLISDSADLSEIQRLTRRKMELLQSGSYSIGDTVVQLLDERIQSLLAATAGLPLPSRSL